MTSIPALLHSALRAHARAEHRRWAKHYVDSGAAGRPSSREAYNIFPRYLMHEALLEAVERVDVHTLTDLAESRDQLIAAMRKANTAMTANVANNPIASAAMEEERAIAIAFAHALSAEKLATVEPLPRRHIVTDDTGRERWQLLASRWKLDSGHSYWYPLSGEKRADAVAFDAGHFWRYVGALGVQSAVRALGVSRVWEFREWGLTAEIDVELLDPRYDGEEGYWSSAEMDWILYASHESSITVGGTLLPAIKTGWTDWHTYQWTGKW